MSVRTLLDSAAAVSNGTTQAADYRPYRKGVYQVEISGTATVKIQGRLDSSASWADLATESANAVGTVDLMPEMRAICSAYTSGTASAWLTE